MKGVVFTVDRRMYVKDFAEPLHESIGEAVDGWIEIVRPRGLPRPFCMIVNEVGLLRELPLNLMGSFWYGTQEHGAPIVGNIVVMKEGWRNGELDLVGLTDQEAADIMEEVFDISNGMIREEAPETAGGCVLQAGGTQLIQEATPEPDWEPEF